MRNGVVHGRVPLKCEFNILYIDECGKRAEMVGSVSRYLHSHRSGWPHTLVCLVRNPRKSPNSLRRQVVRPFLCWTIGTIPFEWFCWRFSGSSRCVGSSTWNRWLLWVRPASLSMASLCQLNNGNSMKTWNRIVTRIISGTYFWRGLDDAAAKRKYVGDGRIEWPQSFGTSSSSTLICFELDAMALSSAVLAPPLLDGSSFFAAAAAVSASLSATLALVVLVDWAVNLLQRERWMRSEQEKNDLIFAKMIHRREPLPGPCLWIYRCNKWFVLAWRLRWHCVRW